MSMLFAGIGEFFNQDCFFLGGMEKEIQEKKKRNCHIKEEPSTFSVNMLE